MKWYKLYIFAPSSFLSALHPCYIDTMPLSKDAIDRSEHVSQNLLDQHKSSKIYMRTTTLKHPQIYINGFQHCHTDTGVTEKYDLGRARQSTFTHTRKCTAFTVSAVKKKCAACLFSLILIKYTTYTFLLKMC